MMGSKAYVRSSMNHPSFVLPLLLLATLLVALLVVIYNSELHDNSAWNVVSKICWKNATVRPPILVVMVICGWGWVVKVCRSASLNLDFVLGGKLQPVSWTYHAALVLFCVLLGTHLVHFIASEVPGVTWRPWLRCNLFLHGAFFVLLALPMQTFYAASRLSLLRTLFDSVVAPLAPVTFWHVIVVRVPRGHRPSARPQEQARRHGRAVQSRRQVLPRTASQTRRPPARARARRIT